MTTFNSRLQLAIIKQKKSKNALEKGFTLVELLITVVILGVLSSVALPALLGNQKDAVASALNAEAMAAAKTCLAAQILEEVDWAAPAGSKLGASADCNASGTATTFTATDDKTPERAIPAVVQVTDTGAIVVTTKSVAATATATATPTNP